MHSFHKKFLLCTGCFVLLLLSGSYSGVRADITDTGTLSVDATVAPEANTVSTTITTNQTATSGQNAEVIVTVSYEATYNGSFPLTLQTNWDLGTVTGQSVPSIDGLTYVMGSASAGYGGSVPLIDLENKQITWEMDSFPSSAGTQQVSFKLRTTAAYTGAQLVRFPVSAGITEPATSGLAETSVAYAYIPVTVDDSTDTTGDSESSNQTPAPATDSSATPTPASSAVSTKANVQSDTLEIRSITNQTASVELFFTTARAVTIRYGTDPRALTNSISSTERKQLHRVTLADLAPNTRYYFQVLDAATGATTAELYTFTSADTPFSLDPNTLSTVVSHHGQLLLYTNLATAELQSSTALTNSVLDVHLFVPDTTSLVGVEAELQNPQVLGLSTVLADAEKDTFQTSTTLTKVRSNLYSGQVRTQRDTGDFQLVFTLYDATGSKATYTAADVFLQKPLTVVDEQDTPLQFAKVSVFRYDHARKQFRLHFTEGVKTNPTTTDASGSISTVFFPGRYQIIVEKEGYESSTTEFSFASNDQFVSPRVQLTSKYPALTQTVLESKQVFASLIWYQDMFFSEVSHHTRSSMLLLLFAAVGLAGLAALYVAHHMQVLLFSQKRFQSIDAVSSTIIYVLAAAVACIAAAVVVFAEGVLPKTLAALVAVTTLTLLYADISQQKKNH